MQCRCIGLDDAVPETFVSKTNLSLEGCLPEHRQLARSRVFLHVLALEVDEEEVDEEEVDEEEEEE